MGVDATSFSERWIGSATSLAEKKNKVTGKPSLNRPNIDLKPHNRIRDMYDISLFQEGSHRRMPFFP